MDMKRNEEFMEKLIQDLAMCGEVINRYGPF